MAHREKKSAKMVQELTMYFFSLGAEAVSSKIERIGENMKITFRADYLPEYEEDIVYLEDCLATEQRNPGMEDVYWELIGSGAPGESSQLLLLAMLVDEYKIRKFENEIELELYRKSANA